MLYAGLDLSRQRLDVHVLDEDGRTVEVMAVRPDADALRSLAAHVQRQGQEVSGVIESMTGSRFVHDTLEHYGWDVAIADAAKAKGLAPLAAKTDKIDARVLAELARRELVPEIWLPTPGVRAERERARFRLHLVRHRTALKNRIHATLMTFGHPVAVSDLFGVNGRQLLGRLAIPEPWGMSLITSLRFVDELTVEIDAAERELQAPRCRPSGHPPPHDGAWRGLGARLHDHLRDRRHPPRWATGRLPSSLPGSPGPRLFQGSHPGGRHPRTSLTGAYRCGAPRTSLLQLLQLVSVLGLLAAYGGATVVLVLVVDWVGAALMLWGSYQEWQSAKGTPA